MGDQEPEKPVDSHFFSSRNKSEEAFGQSTRKPSRESHEYIKIIHRDRKLSTIEATGFEQIME